MNPWMEEALRILSLIVRKPHTPVETAVAGALVLVVFLTIMWLAGLAFKMPDTNLLQRVLAGILVFVVGVAAATAASILAAPKVEKEIVQRAIMIAAPIVAILAIGVPLAMLTMRANYFQTLFTVVLSIAAAWGVSLLSEGIFDSVRAGMKQANKASNHRSDINQVLDSNATTPADAKAAGQKPGRDPRAVAAEKADRKRTAEERAARERALRGQ